MNIETIREIEGRLYVVTTFLVGFESPIPPDLEARLRTLHETMADQEELQVRKSPACKLCYLPRSASPKIERKNGDRIWICPICGNQCETEFKKPMTEALETK